MRILLAHERFLPDIGGGGEIVVYETARHLQCRGHQVKVLTTGDPRVSHYEGIETVRLPISRYRLNLAARQVERHAAGADLIQTFTYHACMPALLAARHADKPVVCTVLALFDRAWHDLRGPIVGEAFRRWERFLVRRPYARTVFLSDFSRDLGVALGVQPERAVVNPPGIDLARFGHSDEKDDTVLFVGKLEDRKGVFDVVEVARRLPDVSFRIVGWGPEEQRLRRLAPANLEVQVLPPGQDLAGIYRRARIFLFPSRAETFGLVLAEAMASSCAIVSSVPFGFEGAHIRPGDPAGTVEKLRALWDNREESLRMGVRNAELAQRFTWDRYTSRLLDIYAEVVAAPR